MDSDEGLKVGEDVSETVAPKRVVDIGAVNARHSLLVHIL